MSKTIFHTISLSGQINCRSVVSYTFPPMVFLCPKGNFFTNMDDVICRKCGLVNDFMIKENGSHKTAFCNGCGAYIKHLAYQEPQFFFGKYKGTKISECDDKGYLEWVLENTRQSERYKTAIQERIEKLTA